MPGLQKKQRCKAVLLGACLGALTFLLVYGPGPLDVTNDAWIWSCYDEGDIVQHYAGESAFLKSAWHFPLGQADTLACDMPKGVNIAFADAIPLAAMFFKLFAPLLPATFQFEGIYAFAAFVLQGISAALVLSLFFERLLPVGIGTLFFTFSPILLERTFRHTSLASHYLILFAVYFYFRHRRDKKLPLGLLAVSAASTGITPYFLPMAAVFALLIAIEHGITATAQERIKSAGFFLLNCAAGMATAWAIGSVGNGYSSSRDGYGHYSMNLNAVINPTSLGARVYGYRWSRILGVRPQLFGQYDGFNYLGVGVIVMLLAGTVLSICARRRKGALRPWLQRNAWLLAVCVFLTLFAASNVIVWDDTVLAEIPLPGRLLSLCSIFRASSRLFYPVYYLLILSGIVVTARGLAAHQAQKLVPLALGLLFALQCYDVSDVLYAKHTQMAQAIHAQVEIPAEFTEPRFKMLYITPHFAQNRMMVALSQKLGLRTNGHYLNTEPDDIWVQQSKEWELLDKLDSGALQGALDPATLYATSDTDRVALWRELYADEADFILWEKPSAVPAEYWTEEFWFMVPRQAPAF